MTEVYSSRAVQDILSREGLAPLKKLGQNFLCDINIVNKIAEAGTPEGGSVIEIGPGLGALTSALLKRTEKVLAIEIDAGMVKALGTILDGYDNIEIIHEDVLKCDMDELAERYFQGGRYEVCANLPYYITGPVIMKILNLKKLPDTITVMVQKEVALRMAARPGDTEYSGFSASVQYFGTPKLLFTVGPSSFYPSPDVDSAVVKLELKRQFDIAFDCYDRVVKGLFGMRRKTVLNNMVKAFGLDPAQARELLEKAGIPSGKRAEELSPADFAGLAGAMAGAGIL